MINAMKVLIVLGTRPEIIKFAPVIHELILRKIELCIVHTGQHYSDNMDKIFWQSLALPNPNYHLGVKEPTHARQLAAMLVQLEDIMLSEKPNWVLVQGDTNSTLAGAICASKIKGIKVAHIEAGLRSFDRNMPEEINRIITDHISDLVLPPTEHSEKLLLAEGIAKSKIYTTGNTVEDALLANIETAKKNSQILQQLHLHPSKYLLLTLHRQENTDDPIVFARINSAIEKIAEKTQLPILFPIHPRTHRRISEFNIKISAQLRCIEPVGYYDFLILQQNAALILTDSGGVQEEACILKVPCITLRENTERPETIEVGANLLAGTTEASILSAFDSMWDKVADWQSPFGGGSAAIRIVDAICKN